MRDSRSLRALALGIVAVLMLVTGNATATADVVTTKTIAIPERVVQAYAEYGIARATLEKTSYAQLTWDEKRALSDLEADDDIDAVINAAIVGSLMSEMSPGIDSVSTTIAGTVYTHARLEDDDE